MSAAPYWKDATATLLAPLIDAARLGIITDVDGTISPIVDQPDAAQVTARSRALLAALQGQAALVAVISGRAAADVQARVGLPGLVYVGNHGLERWISGEVETAPAAMPYRPQLEAVFAALQAQGLPGMIFEDKGATLSIHYRQTAAPQDVARQLGPQVQAAAAAHGLRFFQGRMVFEIRPPLETNKGTAFRDLVHEYHLDAALYLGDDTTDVDALYAARALRQVGDCYAVGLGVVAAETPDSVRTAADVLASGVPGVEAFLAWLLESLAASAS